MNELQLPRMGLSKIIPCTKRRGLSGFIGGALFENKIQLRCLTLETLVNSERKVFPKHWLDEINEVTKLLCVCMCVCVDFQF